MERGGALPSCCCLSATAYSSRIFLNFRIALYDVKGGHRRRRMKRGKKMRRGRRSGMYGHALVQERRVTIRSRPESQPYPPPPYTHTAVRMYMRWKWC